MTSMKRRSRLGSVKIMKSGTRVLKVITEFAGMKVVLMRIASISFKIN
jgi:hypothetical protein